MLRIATALWASVTGSSSAQQQAAAEPASPAASSTVVGAEAYVTTALPALLGRTHLKAVATLSGHNDRVWCVAWHPHRRLLASCSGDKTVRLWGPAATGEWKSIANLEGEHQRTVRYLTWSADGTRLAVASFDSTVTIWRSAPDSDFCDMEVESVLDGHESEVKCVAWRSDGHAIASCSRDKTVQIWEDAQAVVPSAHHRDPDDDDDFGNRDEPDDADRQYDCVAILQGHSQDVKCVRFHPDLGNVIASAGYDDTIKIWEESPNRKDDWHCTQTLKHHGTTVWSLEFQHCRGATPSVPRLLASASDDGCVALWRLVDDSEDRPAGVKAVRWNVACESRGVHEGGAVFAVDWCPSLLAPSIASCANEVSPLLASVGADESLVVYQVAMGEETNALTMSPVVVERSAHANEINCVKFAPAGAAAGAVLLATCGDDGLIKIWELVL